ncbi:MAG: histidine kinase dimerization/phospho-acceptor domain-containing protein [Sphingomonadaceae bacterium]
MRFVPAVWLLIVSALLVLTFAVVSRSYLDPTLSSSRFTAALVAAVWTIGLAVAGAIHFLFWRTEREIRQAARDETVLHLAAAVAHELNQPLTVVISSAELLNNRERTPEDIRALADRIVEASLRMSDIVAKLQHATCYRAKPYVGSVRMVDLDRAS